MVNEIHRTCPLCGMDNAMSHPVSERGGWRLKKCGSCAFVYLENPPPYKDFEDQFAWEKTSANETAERKSREPILHMISGVVKKIRGRYIRPNKLGYLLAKFVSPGKVLDIGCGWGGYFNTLPSGYIPYGVEVSRELSALADQVARGKGGAVVHGNAVEGITRFGDCVFSGVIMSSFLEHESCPLELLRKSFAALLPGGRVVIKVPNYGSLNRWVRGDRWCGFRFPDHVNYWTSDSLIRALTGAGYRIVRFNFFDRMPTSDSMWIVAEKPA